MPHHSATKKHVSSAVSASTQPIAFGSSPQVLAALDYRSRLMAHSKGSPVSHLSSPPPKGSAIVATSASPLINRAPVHVPMHSPVDNSKRSAGSGEATPPTLTSRSGSFESPRGVAASALLLAAHQHCRTDEKLRGKDESEVSMPLKKRKKVTDIMRKKPEESAQPNQVSPVCHGALQAAENSSPQGVSIASTSRASSYDLKDNDGQALSDSAKIIDSKQIVAPMLRIPHFPSILYSILTESPHENVLQWLPHGKAWRIVRFDALRRLVLPTYFPQLREEDGTGSLDGFLWHLDAWGFEEIIEGPDAGAYSHVLFRRGIPQLLEDMRFSPAAEEKDKEKQQLKSPTKDDSRTILQVPSLASTYGGGESLATPPRPGLAPVMPNSSSSYWPQDIPPSIFVNYRPADPSFDMWQHQQQQQQQPIPWMTVVGTATATNTMPLYSPVRVRSGRGAARFGSGSNNHARQEHHVKDTAAPSTISFPVSTRGRARRISLPSRILPPPTTQDFGTSGTNNDDATITLSQSTAQEAVGTKLRSALKRKLPVSSTSSEVAQV